MPTLHPAIAALTALGADNRPIALVAGKKDFYMGNLASGFQKCFIEGDYKGGNYDWLPSGKYYSLEEIQHQDGLTFRPNYVGHLAKTWQGSDLFFSEDDKRSLSEQIERSEYLKSLGIPVVVRLFSGSSSYHNFIRTSDVVTDPDVWRRIERKLLIVADGDLSIETLERQMRFPGANRFKNDQWIEQSVEEINEYSELPTSEGLEAILDATGLFPYGLSDRQFSDYKRWVNKGKKGNNPLLSFPEPIKPPQRKTFANLLNGGNNLIDCVNQATERLGSDGFQVNNLESFQRNKARCECPFHQSKSGNSAYISLHNNVYLFYCRLCTPKSIDSFYFNYCLDKGIAPGSNYPSGKEWVDYAKIYCDRAGITIPEWKPENKEKDNERRTNYLLDKIDKILKSAWKGQKIDVFRAKGDKIVNLPEKADYNGEIITFGSGEAAKLYELAGRMGYKYVLDISPTGSGKTHAVGQLEPSRFFLHTEGEDTPFSRIFYSAPSVRNPNSWAIEDKYFEQAVRNDGYIEDHAKLTPKGKPFRNAIKKGQELTDTEIRTRSNCENTPSFVETYANGHSTEGYCNACKHYETCKLWEGDGYGFLSTNKDFMGFRKVRSHLKAIPTGFVNENTIIILDEAEAAEWVAQFTITEKNINFIKRYFRKNNSGLYYTLLPLFESLSELSDKDNNPAPRYGWTMNELMDKIEIPEGIADHLESIKLTEKAARPSLDEIKNGATINPLFLHPLLSVLLGKKRGSISGGNGALTLTLTNERALEMFSKSHINIFQDATYTPQQLALSLGINESEILVLCQESKKVTNLKIKQYTGAGRMGGDRSSDEQNRVKLWREYFDDFESVGYIEKKAYALPGDLIHGGDGRGSNAFLTKKHIVSIGVYSPNLGAVLNEFQALSGKVSGFDDPEFIEYYGHKVASNVLQEIGRARANRRPDEQLTYHIIADCDLSFLETLGYEVERIEAVTINPELGTLENRTKARNIDKAIAFVREFGEEAWQKLTQKGFANILGISQSALFQWVKKHIGTFAKWKELVMSLVNPKPKPDSIYSEQDKEEIEAAGFMFSMVATVKCNDKEFSQEIKGIVDCFQWKNLIEAINRLSYSLGLRLLFRVIKFAATS